MQRRKPLLHTVASLVIAASLFGLSPAIASAATTAPVADLGKRVASLAAAQVDKPYRFGAEGPNAFDSSGLAQYAYRRAGVDLPRVSRNQAQVGQAVDADDLEPGDLLFFRTEARPARIERVGVYLGGGRLITATSKAGEVIEAPLAGWYEDHLIIARRPSAGDRATWKSRAELIFALGRDNLGVPYVFGADGPQGGEDAFDCSSFTQWLFSQVGVDLPRTSVSQSKLGPKLSAAELRPGDLMFFNASSSRSTSNGVDHVGIYMGNGKILHTYNRSVDVTISNFSGNWKENFLWGVRVLK